MAKKPQPKTDTAINVSGLTPNGHKIKIEYVAIKDLNAAPYNPRTITNAQLNKLAKGISEFGFVDPVIVNTIGNVIVGGHQRTKAAELIGMDTVPVAWVTLDKKKEKALNLALNRISGEWQEDALLEILKELNDSLDFDMELTGFDDDELKALLGEDEQDNLGEEDAETEPVEDPFVQRGDLWVCGDSRILCGDSTDQKDIDRLMQGEKADLCWTDPPYNVDYASKNKSLNMDGGNRNQTPIKNDSFASDSLFQEFSEKVFASMEYALRAGACFYIAHAEGGSLGTILRHAVDNTTNLLNKQCLIWIKNCHVLGRQDYNWKHEPILYGWKEGAAHYFNGDFSQTTVMDDDQDISKLSKSELLKLAKELRQKEPTTVIRVDKPLKSVDHPTQKPVRLVERCIYASSRPNEIVIDLFNGSGTTLIACRKTGRQYRGCELEPGYIQSTLKRYQEYCGEEPQLLNADGSTTPFSIVEKQRKAKK